MVIKEFHISELTQFEKYQLSFPINQNAAKEIFGKFQDMSLISIDTNNVPVTGHDIIAWLKASKIENFYASVVESSPYNLFRSYLYKETFFEFTLTEKLIFLKKAIPDFTIKEIRKQCNPDFKITDSLISNLDALTSGKISTLLAENKLSLKNCIRLNDSFCNKDRISLIRMFSSNNFSHSNQQKILEISEEIIFRDKKSLESIHAIFSDGYEFDQINPSEIIRVLTENRYPELTRNQDSWNSMIKSLRLPGNIKMIPSQNFESRKVTIEITATDQNKAVQIVEKLKND